MVAAPITAASPETPARMRARPQLRRSSWVVAEVLSLRTTWWTPPNSQSAFWRLLQRCRTRKVSPVATSA